MNDFTNADQLDIIGNTCDALTRTAREYWNQVVNLYYDFFTKTICTELAAQYNIDINDILIENEANNFRGSISDRLRAKLKTLLSTDISNVANCAIQARLCINIIDLKFDSFEVKLVDNKPTLLIGIKGEGNLHTFAFDWNTNVSIAVNRFIQELTRGKKLLATGGQVLKVEQPEEDLNSVIN
jgi:hypothetical protein